MPKGGVVKMMLKERELIELLHHLKLVFKGWFPGARLSLILYLKPSSVDESCMEVLYVFNPDLA